MGKFNEYLNKKIVPIPALYKNPYFGTLKDLFSKENKGETVTKEYVKTQLNTDYLNRIKNNIYDIMKSIKDERTFIFGEA